MKNLKKYFMGMVMLAVLLVLPVKISAATSTMNLNVGTTDNAAAGEAVTVRLVGSNNPGISTFAVKLTYDSDYLTYNNATWSSTITSDSGNMQMITPTTENNQPVLNISSVMVNNYSNNETIVTLNFTAKRAYTTMPVTLTSREVTDASYNPVNVSIVVDATAGLTSQSQSSTTSQSTSQNSSQSTSQTTSQDASQSSSQSSSQTASQSTSQSSSQTTVSNNSSASEDTDSEDFDSEDYDSEDLDSEDTEDELVSSSGKSGSNGSSTKGSSSKGVDKTPKTGAIDVRAALAIVIVVFLVIAGICIYVLGKKKERHTL